jgi:hypothetical protein
VPGVPPVAVHASADGRNEHDVSVQSASVVHALPSAHAPATQVELVVVVQFTKPSVRPQVERAAQRCDDLRQRRLTAPADSAIAALLAFATQRTYWPWFFHGTTAPVSSVRPSHGQAAAIEAAAASTAAASQAAGPPPLPLPGFSGRPAHALLAISSAPATTRPFHLFMSDPPSEFWETSVGEEAELRGGRNPRNTSTATRVRIAGQSTSLPLRGATETVSAIPRSGRNEPLATAQESSVRDARHAGRGDA